MLQDLKACPSPSSLTLLSGPELGGPADGGGGGGCSGRIPGAAEESCARDTLGGRSRRAGAAPPGGGWRPGGSPTPAAAAAMEAAERPCGGRPPGNWKKGTNPNNECVQNEDEQTFHIRQRSIRDVFASRVSVQGLCAACLMFALAYV